MHNVIILGTGTIAQHLFSIFHKTKEINVVQVVGRNLNAHSFFSKNTNTTADFKAIEDADIYVIAVKDDAIPTVSKYLKNKKGIIVHTSGCVAMQNLENTGNRGVFYPLQTFTKGQKVNFKKIPICIEAEKENSNKVLKKLAVLISDSVYDVTSKKRRELHLAAVFINNFTNHMYRIGNDICTQAGLPFSILEPLIMETANKAILIGPEEAQTGPAKREDTKTIKSHLSLLKNNAQKNLYTILSDAIKNTYGEKL